MPKACRAGVVAAMWLGQCGTARAASGCAPEDEACKASIEESSLLQWAWPKAPAAEATGPPPTSAAEKAWNSKASEIASKTPPLQGSSKPDGAPRGIAFEGGGFVAQADYVGIAAGLLHVLPSVNSDCGKSGCDLGVLFKNFPSFSGVSGGAWFASQIMYSQTYDDLIYKSACQPSGTEDEWRNFYRMVLDPKVNVSNPGTKKGIMQCLMKSLDAVKSLSGLQESAETGFGPVPSPTPPLEPTPAPAPTPTQWYQNPHYLPWFKEMIGELLILIQAGGVTWMDLVGNMFERGSSIKPDLPLGTKSANGWAHGKLYVQGVSAVTPPGDDSDSLSQVNITGQSTKGGVTKLFYDTTAPATGDAYEYTPAKYSVIVGKGTTQNSVEPFCANEDCFGRSLTYHYTAGTKPWTKERSLQDIYSVGFEQKAGMLPVTGTAAVSSAFEGRTVVEMGLGAIQGCVELAVWASAGMGNGKAFTAGRKLRDQLALPLFPVNEWMADRTAKEGLQPLVDGGVTDPTGVSHLLAKNERIMVWINTGPGTMDWGAFLDMFEGEGSDNPSRALFKSPQRKEVQQMLDDHKFDSIPAKEGSKFLQYILFGDLSCETLGSPQFGIPANSVVQLDFIAVETEDITLGLIEEGSSYNSFFNFATLTGEITQTLTLESNVPMTQKLLRDNFL